MTDDSQRIVEANGVALCVQTFGDPADPAVLLVHGAGNSMLSWDVALCERLAAGGRLVVRYDLRDAGRSVTYEAGAPPYGLRDLVADAAGLLDALGLAQAHVVGLSLGAGIGQLLALEHPERVAALTLASSTPGIPGQEGSDLPGPAEGLFANEPPEPDWTDRAAVIEHLVESERPYASPSRGFDEAAMRALATRVFDGTTSVQAMLTNVFMIDAGEPWRPRLADITARTLVLHGAEDPLFPLPHGRALAAEIPGAELVALERTGHEYPPPETWDAVVPAILR